MSKVMRGEDGGKCCLCLAWVLGQKDLQDPSLLRQRLHITPATAPVAELGWEVLLIATARPIGLIFLLHLDRGCWSRWGPRRGRGGSTSWRRWRRTSIPPYPQRDDLKEVEEATEEGEVRGVLFQGGAGSGKTSLAIKTL